MKVICGFSSALSYINIFVAAVSYLLIGFAWGYIICLQTLEKKNTATPRSVAKKIYYYNSGLFIMVSLPAHIWLTWNLN